MSQTGRMLGRWVDAGLARSPAQWVFERRSLRRLTVLAYHGVDDAPQFARQLDLLQASCTPVSLAHVLAAIHRRRTLPERPVLVTFDDGDPSVLDLGLPALERRRIPAALFVVARAIGTTRPHWWVEVDHLLSHGGEPGPRLPRTTEALVQRLKTVPNTERLVVLERLRGSATGTVPPARQLSPTDLKTLEAGGVSIGNHSATHPCLDRCGDELIRDEVSSAHSLLTEMLGHPPCAFAYPNGNWDARVRQAVASEGYGAAFLFDHRQSRLPPGDPLAISRVRVGTTTTLTRFSAIISGLHPALHAARMRLFSRHGAP